MPIDAVERFRNRWLMHFQLIHHDVHKAKKKITEEYCSKQKNLQYFKWSGRLAYEQPYLISYGAL